MMEWRLGERLVVPGGMESPPEVMGSEAGLILVGPGVMELGVAH